MPARALGPLNAGLAANPLESQVNGEGASLPEGADALIVAPPRYAKLQAIILVLNADTVAHRLEAIGHRQRVFALVSKIDDRGAEYRPVALEQDARGEPQLFLVAQVLDRRIDVSIEAQVADLCVGLGGS